MKWIKVESEKDLPKGGIGKKLFIKHKGERYVLFMGYEGWQWVTGFLIKDEDWPHIEWLDESINQELPDELNEGQNERVYEYACQISHGGYLDANISVEYVKPLIKKWLDTEVSEYAKTILKMSEQKS